MNKNEKRYLGILILVVISALCYYIVAGSPEIELYTEESIAFLMTPAIIGGSAVLLFIAADIVNSKWTFWYAGILGAMQLILAMMLREGLFFS